jgi:hypothetical protein
MRAPQAALILLALVSLGCWHWFEPEVAIPTRPGDACADHKKSGPRPCPDGMWCQGDEYGGRHHEHKLLVPGRCHLENNRCATDCDCPAQQICVRTAPAAGWCGPAPALSAPARPCS